MKLPQVSLAILIALSIGLEQVAGFTELSQADLDLCLREADAKLPSLPVPEIISRMFHLTIGLRAPGKVFDTSHEFADKVMSLMSPQLQKEFDSECSKFWPQMIQLRDSTSCGRSLEHYVGIYQLERNRYLTGHDLFRYMIDMYQMCFTVRCKQAHDRKVARMTAREA